jgi:hypothetical protein
VESSLPFNQLELGDYGHLKTLLHKPSEQTENQGVDSSRPSFARHARGQLRWPAILSWATSIISPYQARPFQFSST